MGSEAVGGFELKFIKGLKRPGSRCDHMVPDKKYWQPQMPREPVLNNQRTRPQLARTRQRASSGCVNRRGKPPAPSAVHELTDTPQAGLDRQPPLPGIGASAQPVNGRSQSPRAIPQCNTLAPKTLRLDAVAKMSTPYRVPSGAAVSPETIRYNFIDLIFRQGCELFV